MLKERKLKYLNLLTLSYIEARCLADITKKIYRQIFRFSFQCSQKYIRPLDVNTLMGDATKAKQILKWEPKHDIKSLIKDMINNA